MPKALNLSVVTVFFVLSLFSFVFSEDITITTYYPSPYGSYNELQLVAHAQTTVCDAATKRGLLFYDESNDQVKVCRRISTGPDVYAWQPVGGGGGEAPAGAVMFFNLAVCPAGWSEVVNARGRYIVGLPSGGTLGGIPAGTTALSDLENREVGQHSHGLPGFPSAGVGPNTGVFTTWGYGLRVYRDTNVAGSVAGTNAPYIQFLVCQKD